MRELNKEKMIKNVEKRILNDIENNYIAGANVFVAQHGEVLLQKAYGYSDFDNKTPLKNNSIFRIASMSKPVLSCAAAILADSGKLDLYKKVSDYLPQFSKVYFGEFNNHSKGTRGEEVKTAPLVHQLFNHSSGFGSGVTYPVCFSAPDSAYESLENVVNYYSENAFLEFEPGTRSNYSGIMGFDIAARIIEVITGMDYREFVKQNVLEPLEMHDTTYNLNDEQKTRLVEMFFIGQEGARNIPMLDRSYGRSTKGYSPAGAGLYSTAEDYSHFAQMLAGKGIYKGKRIISEGAFNILTAKYLPDDLQTTIEDSRWGLGLTVDTETAKHRVPGSMQWGGAYGTGWFADPTNEIVAVYMKNSHYLSLPFAAWMYEFEDDVNTALE